MGDYNGWRNRATWGVVIILDNEEDYYHLVTGLVEEYAESGMTREEAKEALADAIENLAEEEYEQLPTHTWPMLMRQLLDDPCMMEIDYWGIAERYIDDYECNNPDYVWAKASQCKKRSAAKPQGAKRNTSKAKAGKSKTSSSNARPKARTPGKAPAKRTTAKKPARATSRRY